MRSSWSAIRFGVKPRWNSALTRSCLGGSMADEHRRARARAGRSRRTRSRRRAPRSRSRQSRLTACTSSAVVTDQKPASSGYCSIFSVQCTGHLPRISLNSSYGGPSSHSSVCASSTLLMSDAVIPICPLLLVVSHVSTRQAFPGAGLSTRSSANALCVAGIPSGWTIARRDARGGCMLQGDRGRDEREDRPHGPEVGAVLRGCPYQWRRWESNPRPRSREDGFYERSRRSDLIPRSPRRRGCGGPAS